MERQVAVKVKVGMSSVFRHLHLSVVGDARICSFITPQGDRMMLQSI